MKLVTETKSEYYEKIYIHIIISTAKPINEPQTDNTKRKFNNQSISNEKSPKINNPINPQLYYMENEA